MGSKKRSKVGRIVLAIILIFILLNICIWLLIDYAIRPYIRHDNQKWIDGDFGVGLEVGGKTDVAKIFIPAHEDVSDEIECNFYIHDSFNYPYALRLDQLPIACLLEITYPEEIFQFKLDEALSKYEFSDVPYFKADKPATSVGGDIGNYKYNVVYKFEPFMIAWNDSENKIRYVCFRRISVDTFDKGDEHYYLEFIKNSFRLEW